MKKNNMMRLASVLLVLVLLTTCAISGTFAKYTSTATGGDKARVAYWGWGSNNTIDFDLFDGNYNDTVLSENGDQLVAPGTSKTETFQFAYAPTADGKALTAGAINAPEVDYDFTVNLVVTGDYSDLDANTNFKWIVNTTECATVEDLIAAVKLLSGEADGTARIEAGNLPAAFATKADPNADPAVLFANKDITIGWVWDFDDEVDAGDTNMGNGLTFAGAADAGVLDDINLAITITATQVD